MATTEQFAIEIKHDGAADHIDTWVQALLPLMKLQEDKASLRRFIAVFLNTYPCVGLMEAALLLLEGFIRASDMTPDQVRGFTDVARHGLTEE